MTGRFEHYDTLYNSGGIFYHGVKRGIHRERKGVFNYVISTTNYLPSL